MITGTLAKDDYVVCVGGSHTGKRGLVVEIDPDGISFVDFGGNEIVCSYAQLHRVLYAYGELVIQDCKWCGTRLPSDAFYESKTNKTGFDYVCKTCRRSEGRLKSKAAYRPVKQRNEHRKERDALVKELLGLLDRIGVGCRDEYCVDAIRIQRIAKELKDDV